MAKAKSTTGTVNVPAELALSLENARKSVHAALAVYGRLRGKYAALLQPVARLGEQIPSNVMKSLPKDDRKAIQDAFRVIQSSKQLGLFDAIKRHP